MSSNANPNRLVLLCLITLLWTAPHTGFAQQRRGASPGQNTPSNFHLDPGKRSAVVPFTPVGNLILVQVGVNGAPPAWMVFDTGTPTTTINPRLATGLGRASRRRARTDGSSDAAGGTPLTGATLTLPGLEATNQAVVALPLTAMTQKVGFVVDGILGSSFIRGWAVNVDYTAHTLTFYDAANYPPPGGQGSLPLVEIGGIPYVSADLSLTGNDTVSGLFKVDTGSEETLSVSKKFADAQGMLTKIPVAQTVAGVGANTTDARISRLRFGEYTINQPVIRIGEDLAEAAAAPPPPPPPVPAPVPPNTGGRGNARRRAIEQRQAIQARIQNAVAGTIGSGLLHRFTLVLDSQARVMSLRPNAQFSTPFETDMSGLDLSGMPNGSGVLIHAVLPGSPAESAGLRANDLIVAVDGHPAATIGLVPLAGMFQKTGTNYTLTVRRGGMNFQARLTTKRVI